MSASEVAEFERNPHHRAAVELRRRDDEAKVPRLPTPGFDHFRPHVEACLVG
jgi:predicted HD phosphohydrolase